MAKKSREQKSEQTRVVGYVRVSSEQQADQGVSLQAQEEKSASTVLSTISILLRSSVTLGYRQKRSNVKDYSRL